MVDTRAISTTWGNVPLLVLNLGAANYAIPREVVRRCFHQATAATAYQQQCLLHPACSTVFVKRLPSVLLLCQSSAQYLAQQPRRVQVLL